MKKYSLATRAGFEPDVNPGGKILAFEISLKNVHDIISKFRCGFLVLLHVNLNALYTRC